MAAGIALDAVSSSEVIGGSHEQKSGRVQPTRLNVLRKGEGVSFAKQD
jgi:hypothetical protein